MKAIFTFLACLGLAISATYSGNSTGVNYAFHGPYSFVGSAGTNTAEVQLNFDNFNYVSSLVMYVKKTNTPPTLTEMDFDNYEHKNPTSSSSYDLQNANSGQRQIVSVGGLVPGDNIYIFVVNLISRANAQYKINVTERIGPNPAYCASGNPQALGSIYCINCNNNLTYGAFCDISTTVLPGNMIYSPVIPAWNDVKPNFATITIPTSSSTINLYYTSSITAVLVLVQFKYFSSEVAGLVNFASGGFKLVNQTVTQFTVPINSGGTNDISVSFINLNVNPANLQVWYQVQTSSNILVIVLGVLGGILFVGLVIVAICVIRRMRNPSQQVNPISAVLRSSSVRIQNVNDLNPQQIETYFPAVLCKNVIIEEEQPSSINLATNNQKDAAADRDCVICLCAVVSTEMIKVTYCRHIFHALCLNKWFQKQRNCPYCRQDYNRKSTIEHYQTLLGLTHKNMLAGIDLAKQILAHKQKSNVVIEQIKD